jgi:hypothetical protein
LTIELQHGLAVGRGYAKGRDRNNEEGALHRAPPALNDIAKLRRRPPTQVNARSREKENEI